jgi:hypothetical protein
VELTSEEKARVLRNTPRGVQVIQDEDSQNRRRSRYDAEQALHQKERQEYYDRVKAVEEQKAREEQSAYELKSGGRHKLLTNIKQVLFEERECYACGTKCMFAMDNWNPARNMMNYDIETAYDISVQDEYHNFPKKHSCHTNSIEEMSEIMDRKIAYLTKKIKDQHEYNQKYYRHQAFL